LWDDEVHSGEAPESAREARALPEKTNLHGAEDMRRCRRSAPPADQDESIGGVAERESRDQDPDIDIAPAADATDEAIEVRDVIQIAAHLPFHRSFREPINHIRVDEQR
jgi:hypothetical protein